MITMTTLGCAVCAAFPDHKGTHYSVDEIWARLRYHRLRSWGKSKWIELPDCYSANDCAIMATAHMTNHPGLHNVTTGCYLCEATADFDPEAYSTIEEASEELLEDEEVAEGLVQTEALAPDTDVDAELKTEDEIAAPDETTERLRQEARLMADQDAKGYVAWVNGGLQVEIRASSNGGSGSDVAALKKALTRYEPPDNVLVTVTETLGKGEAWVTIAVNSGGQGALLVSAGSIVDQLVDAGVYDEILLVNGG